MLLFFKKLSQHLLWRMVFILVIPVILLQAIVGIVFYRQYIDNDIEESVKKIENTIDFTNKYLDKYPHQQDESLSLMSQHYSGLYKIVPFSQKHRKKCKLTGIMRLVAMEMKNKRSYFRLCSVKNSSLYRIYVPLDLNRTLRITQNKRYFVSAQWHFLPVWTLGSSMILLFIAFCFMKNQLRPVVKLGKAAEAFGKGVWDYKLMPTGSVELRNTAIAFLNMREKIRAYIDGRTILLAGVSHDLRTILTRQSLELSMMPSSQEVINLKDDIKLMEDIISSYLEFVSHNHDAAYQIINIKEAISNLTRRFVDNNKKIDFTYQGEENILLRQNSIERCVLNLLTNSLKYANYIKITMNNFEQKLFFSIEDNGVGVDDNDLENIFKPFYTAGYVGQGSVSTGLGLTLTKDIILSYGGQIYAIKSNDLGGLKVIFEFVIQV